MGSLFKPDKPAPPPAPPPAKPAPAPAPTPAEQAVSQQGVSASGKRRRTGIRVATDTSASDQTGKTLLGT
jgi:hypothetical protein